MNARTEGALLLQLRADGGSELRDPQARELAHLFWIFSYLSLAVWLLVVVAMLIAVLRRSRGETGRFELDEKSERRAAAIVAGLAVITGVIVLV